MKTQPKIKRQQYLIDAAIKRIITNVDMALKAREQAVTTSSDSTAAVAREREYAKIEKVYEDLEAISSLSGEM